MWPGSKPIILTACSRTSLGFAYSEARSIFGYIPFTHIPCLSELSFSVSIEIGSSAVLSAAVLSSTSRRPIPARVDSAPGPTGDFLHLHFRAEIHRPNALTSAIEAQMEMSVARDGARHSKRGGSGLDRQAYPGAVVRRVLGVLGDVKTQRGLGAARQRVGSLHGHRVPLGERARLRPEPL